MRAADIGRAILGVGLVLVAAIGTAVYIVVPVLMTGPGASGLATIAFAVAAVGGGLGVLLIRDGARRRATAVPPVLALPPVWFWLICTASGLILGAVTGRARWAAYLFPPFHVLTFVGWTGFLASLLSARLPKLTARDATTQLAYGSLVATTVGGVFELILFLILGVGAFLISTVLPSGSDWIASIQRAASVPGSLEEFADLVTLPPVVAVLGLSLMVGAPLVEEGLKGVGTLLGEARDASSDHYFAWGLWSGLGFGLMESLVNAASMGAEWVPAVLSRFLTVGMHGLTGALMGTALYFGIRERRLWRALGISALCLSVHALWNGTALAIALLALRGTPALGALP